MLLRAAAKIAGLDPQPPSRRDVEPSRGVSINDYVNAFLSVSSLVIFV